MRAKLLIFLSISTFITLRSLNAQVADPGPIPAVFTCEGILIIEQPPHKTSIYGYDKAVKKKFEDYKGKYVLATEKDIQTDSLYQDKKTYKFILHLKWQEEVRLKDGRREIWGRMRYFFLEDRETSNTYKGIGEKSNEKETFEHTVRMLNANCK